MNPERNLPRPDKWEPIEDGKEVEMTDGRKGKIIGENNGYWVIDLGEDGLVLGVKQKRKIDWRNIK